MNQQELKIIGLKQAIAERFSEYEERIVDLRVEITMLTEQNAKLQEELQKVTSQPLEGNVLLPEE